MTSTQRRRHRGTDATVVMTTVAGRLRTVLSRLDAVPRQLTERVLAEGAGILGPRPASTSTALVIGACMAVGGSWRRAVWPAVGTELALAAADLLDDAADAEIDVYAPLSAGVISLSGAAVAALAMQCVLRALEDGVSRSTTLRLGATFSDYFARSCQGQAHDVNVSVQRIRDLGEALALATAKSGSLGIMATLVGALAADVDGKRLDLMRHFGQHYALFCQLRNDALDASESRPHKRDIRVGKPTVPLFVTGSVGAPPDLDRGALENWESKERSRIARRGGVAAAMALAEAERIRARGCLNQIDRMAAGNIALLSALVDPASRQG